jgi:hypothetical protein
VLTEPRRTATVAAAIEPLMEAGHISPIVGGSYALGRAGRLWRRSKAGGIG